MIQTLVLWVALGPLPTDPFVRSKVREPPLHCLYWPEANDVVWHTNQQANLDEPPDDSEFDATRAAFKTWSDQFQSCGNLSIKEGALTASRDVGWFQTSGVVNENIIVWRQKKCSEVVPMNDSCLKDENDLDDCGNKYDCWQHQSAAIALTTTTFDPKSGRILDADIELNQPSFVFTTVDAPKCVAPDYRFDCVAWDLQNTLTHEIGHMVGLDHTGYPGSTMQPTAPPGEITKRVLDPGTASFVCDVYARGKVSRDCIIVPVSGTLGDVPRNCSVAPGALGLLPVAAWLARRRRRA